MYLADYHVHSSVSPDAKPSMTAMAQAAIAAGLDEICFTDHVEPMVWGSHAVKERHDWTPALREFRAAQAAVGDRIALRLGAELGDVPWNAPAAERIMAAAPALDFVIGSIHMLPDGQDLYEFAPADEAEARRGIAVYLGQVQKLAEWDGPFSVLGHLTLPLRYLNEIRGFHLTFDGFEPEVERILRTLIASGRGIELNTNRGNTPLPDEKWLRMYHDLGGEIITLGSDAHSTRFVGCAIPERQALLRRCGFTRFCTFRHMEPVWREL